MIEYSAQNAPEKSSEKPRINSLTQSILEDVCNDFENIDIVVPSSTQSKAGSSNCVAKQLCYAATSSTHDSVPLPESGTESNEQSDSASHPQEYTDHTEPIQSSVTVPDSCASTSVDLSYLHKSDVLEEDENTHSKSITLAAKSSKAVNSVNSGVLSSSSFNITDSPVSFVNTPELQQMQCISIKVITEDAVELSELSNSEDAFIQEEISPAKTENTAVKKNTRHVKRNSSKPSMRIGECSMKARRISAKNKAMWTEELESTGRLVCPMQGCHQTYVTVANFQTHYKWCTGKKNLQHCPYCESLIFSGHEAVLQHMEVEHPDKLDEYKEQYPADETKEDKQPALSEDFHEEDQEGEAESKSLKPLMRRHNKHSKNKNLKKRNFSTKENFLFRRRSLKQGLKSIERTINQNFQQFEKCVRFNDIVQKINSVADDSSSSSKVRNERNLKSRGSKQNGILLEASISESETNYFADESDCVDCPGENDPSKSPKKLSTKSRIVLNTQGYERYNQYLKLTRDWSSHRRTYSRRRPLDRSVHLKRSKASLPSDVQDAFQLHESGSSVSLAVTEEQQSCEMMDLSIDSPVIKKVPEKATQILVNHAKSKKKGKEVAVPADSGRQQDNFSTQHPVLEDSQRGGAKLPMSYHPSFKPVPIEPNYGHIVFSKPNKVATRERTTCYDNAGSCSNSAIKPEYEFQQNVGSEKIFRREGDVECDQELNAFVPAVIDFDQLIGADPAAPVPTVQEKKLSKKKGKPCVVQVGKGNSFIASRCGGKKLKQKTSKHCKQDGVKLPESFKAEKPDEKKKSQRFGKRVVLEGEKSAITYNEALQMCFNEEISNVLEPVTDPKANSLPPTENSVLASSGESAILGNSTNGNAESDSVTATVVTNKAKEKLSTLEALCGDVVNKLTRTLNSQADFMKLVSGICAHRKHHSVLLSRGDTEQHIAKETDSSIENSETAVLMIRNFLAENNGIPDNYLCAILGSTVKRVNGEYIGDTPQSTDVPVSESSLLTSRAVVTGSQQQSSENGEVVHLCSDKPMCQIVAEVVSAAASDVPTSSLLQEPSANNKCDLGEKIIERSLNDVNASVIDEKNRLGSAVTLSDLKENSAQLAPLPVVQRRKRGRPKKNSLEVYATGNKIYANESAVLLRGNSAELHGVESLKSPGAEIASSSAQVGHSTPSFVNGTVSELSQGEHNSSPGPLSSEHASGLVDNESCAIPALKENSASPVKIKRKRGRPPKVNKQKVVQGSAAATGKEVVSLDNETHLSEENLFICPQVPEEHVNDSNCIDGNLAVVTSETVAADGHLQQPSSPDDLPSSHVTARDGVNQDASISKTTDTALVSEHEFTASVNAENSLALSNSLCVRKSTRLRKRKIDPDTVFLQPKKTLKLSQPKANARQGTVPNRRGRPRKTPLCNNVHNSEPAASTFLQDPDAMNNTLALVSQSQLHQASNAVTTLTEFVPSRKGSRKGRPRKCVRYADLNSGIESAESLDGIPIVSDSSTPPAPTSSEGIIPQTTMDPVESPAFSEMDVSANKSTDCVLDSNAAVPEPCRSEVENVEQQDVSSKKISAQKNSGIYARKKKLKMMKGRKGKSGMKGNKAGKHRAIAKGQGVSKGDISEMCQMQNNQNADEEPLVAATENQNSQVEQSEVYETEVQEESKQISSAVDVSNIIDSSSSNRRRSRSAAVKARKMLKNLINSDKTLSLCDQPIGHSATKNDEEDDDFVPPPAFRDSESSDGDDEGKLAFEKDDGLEVLNLKEPDVLKLKESEMLKLKELEEYYDPPPPSMQKTKQTASKALMKEWAELIETEGKVVCQKEGCGKVFHTKLGMTYHYEVACGKAQLKWKCKLCGKRCKLSVKLMSSHIQSHHPEKTKKRYNVKTVPDGLPLEFLKKCDSRGLFPRFKVKQGEVTLLSLSDYEKYLPPLETSAKMKFHNLSSKESSSWVSLNCFESYSLKGDACHTTFFTGGPVLSSAWCPTPAALKVTQYIALTSGSSMETTHHSFSTKRSEGLIQLWDVGELSRKTMKSKPVLRLAIPHVYGDIRDIVWCPTGCWDDPSDEVPQEFLPRLGMLAAACTDSYIRIFSIPHPQRLSTPAAGNFPFYDLKPVVVLEPLGVDGGGPCLATHTAICMSVSWQQTDGCERFLGGYSNGLIVLWHLASSSGILVKRIGSSLHLLPSLTFQAHGSPVTSVVFAPLSGGHWCASSSYNKSLKVWDLHDPYMPVVETKRGSATRVQWPSVWTGVIVSLDDGLGTARNSTFYEDLGHPKSRQKCISSHNACVWSCSISDWLNAQIVGDSFGDVSVCLLKRLNEEHVKSFSTNRYPIFRTELEPLEVCKERCNDIHPTHEVKDHISHQRCCPASKECLELDNEVRELLGDVVFCVSMFQEDVHDDNFPVNSSNSVFAVQNVPSEHLVEHVEQRMSEEEEEDGDCTSIRPVEDCPLDVKLKSTFTEEGVNSVEMEGTSLQNVGLAERKRPTGDVSAMVKSAKSSKTSSGNFDSNDADTISCFTSECRSVYASEVCDVMSDMLMRCEESVQTALEEPPHVRNNLCCSEICSEAYRKLYFMQKNSLKTATSVYSDFPEATECYRILSERYALLPSQCKCSIFSLENFGVQCKCVETPENVAEELVAASQEVETPHDYTAVSKKYGLVFMDVDLVDIKNIPPNEVDRARKEMTSEAPLEKCQIMSINTVSWNPNYESRHWLFTAAHSGLVRLLCASGLEHEQSASGEYHSVPTKQ